MPIPDFQTIMLPFLKQIADGQEHSTTETHNSLARHFNLTDEEANKIFAQWKSKDFLQPGILGKGTF